MLDRSDERLDQIFRALAHPVRRDILRRISRESVRISDLAEPFDMTLEGVSQHVRILERARLLKRTREGREHWCRLDPAPLKDAGIVLGKLGGFWGLQLSSLERFLERPPSKD
jgi:DNA-binding transcriptional ArsR family regulator